MEKIAAFIDGTPVISDLQKQFYSRYLQARYDLILSPAYKLLNHKSKLNMCISDRPKPRCTIFYVPDFL